MAPLPGRSRFEPIWVPEVLRFWFEELPIETWFKRDDTVDQTIRQRFGALHSQHASESFTPETAREALAAVIVLDQFSRNMFRGLAQAFATDSAARDISHAAIARGWDRALDVNRRLFLYLPFEHSEDLLDQARSVALIAALGDPRLTGYALAHQRIIDRFGRFPHRNAALGRTSTFDELAFLQGPESSF